MKITEKMWTEEIQKEIKENFKEFHEEYFSEYPMYEPYISYSLENGYICEAYIGVEDEDGNAIPAGIDDHITNYEGETFSDWEVYFEEWKKRESVKKLALWKDHLQNVYDNFEEWKSYSEMYGLCERLGYENEEEAWEANPLIQGSEQPEDFKVVKSQVEEPIVEEPTEEPTEKEFEMEFMSDYKDVKYAISWKDQIPTDEEMEVIKKYLINEGYEDENFMIFTLEDYLEQTYEVLEDACPTYFDYIDEAEILRDYILNSGLEIIKTPNGYAAVELYH